MAMIFGQNVSTESLDSGSHCFHFLPYLVSPVARATKTPIEIQVMQHSFGS